jgi:(2Fe-2S) ferredoxin
VKPEDVDEIIESHVVGGKPLARLVIPDDKLTGRAP